MEERWDSQMVQAMKFQSWGDNEVDQDAPPIFQEPDPEAREHLVQDEQDPTLREFYLRKEDFIRHGHTDGCPKCSFIIDNSRKAGGPPHSG